jgi:uncharacterized membrane protein
MSEETKQESVETPKAESVVFPKADASDIEQNKAMALVGYIIPILFFVPMLSEKKSPFGMFHANQQLVFFLFSSIGTTVSIILMAALIGFLLLPLVGIASMVFMIMGIINASNGEMKPLPLIGGISILK